MDTLLLDRIRDYQILNTVILNILDDRDSTLDLEMPKYLDLGTYLIVHDAESQPLGTNTGTSSLYCNNSYPGVNDTAQIRFIHAYMLTLIPIDYTRLHERTKPRLSLRYGMMTNEHIMTNHLSSYFITFSLPVLT